MTDHTPEPWKTYNNGLSINNGQRHVGHCEDVEDAARIVACVNACAGIPTEQLAKVAGDLAAFHGLIFDIVMSDEAPPSERIEQLGNVKTLVEAAEAELASPGSHTLTRSKLNNALHPFRED